MIRRTKSGRTPFLADARYAQFCALYQDDFVGYVMDHSRRPLTWQQYEVAIALQKPGARVAIASGHGTGKSWLLAWLLDWHLRCLPFSNAVLTATNIEQARSAIWKYLDEVIADVESKNPWMKGQFIKETKRYYMRLKKDSWYVLPKTAPKSAPENVAGQHNENYLVVVDEASGVADPVLGVLRGALTQGEGNRFVMVSQPTRPNGHFAEAFTTLRDIYDCFNLNSELSPIVDKTFIREKLIEYKGHHSPEYQIKVLGQFPDNLSGYLIPKRWIEICQTLPPLEHKEPWGWVVCVDVAEGKFRDSSVWTIGKVSGFGDERLVDVVECQEFLDKNEKQFARLLYQRLMDLPGVTVAIDGDGAGRTVILELEELGFNPDQIHWGIPCHTKTDRLRYSNQRAYANVKLREAVFDERIRVARQKAAAEQGSRIPYGMDDKGRYYIWTKERMLGEGIHSPDIWDTHAFFYLVDYVPVGDNTGSGNDDMLKWAQQIIGKAA